MPHTTESGETGDALDQARKLAFRATGRASEFNRMVALHEQTEARAVAAEKEAEKWKTTCDAHAFVLLEAEATIDRIRALAEKAQIKGISLDARKRGGADVAEKLLALLDQQEES